MATPPTTNQTFKIVGTLDIVGNEDVTSPTFSSQGLIRMSRADGTPLGSVRGIADPTYRGLVVETAGMPAGFSVRTRLNQGPSSIGGIGDKYPLNCVSNITTTSFLNCVADKTYNGVNQNFGQPMILAERYSTEDVSNAGGSSPIARFLQTTHKEDENVVIHLGARSKTVMGCLGYNMFSNVLTDRLWLGFASPSSQVNAPIKCIKMDVQGNVEIPTKLTVTTISATNYLNLPALQPSQLLPLTLNTTTNRVGINQISPSAALDVTGNAHVTGTVDAGNVAAQNSLLVGGAATIGGDAFVQHKLTANTIEGTNWIGYPSPDLAPITLDHTNNRVGVNQANPQFAVDVTGDVHATGTVGAENLTAQTNLAVAGTGTMHDAFVLNKVTTDTIEATNWIGLPPVDPTDLLPITLDQANGRVGVSFASPSNTLDVGGTIGATSFITSSLGVFPGGPTGAVVKSGTGDPEGQKVGAVGSLYLRTDGASGTSLYTKTSGTGTAGWSPIGGPPDLLPITLDKVNNRVGINKDTPEYDLDVSANARIPSIFGINWLKFGDPTTGAYIRVAASATPGITGYIGSIYSSTAGSGVWYKESDPGLATGWVKLQKAKSNNQMRLKSTKSVYNTMGDVNNYVISTAGLDVGSSLVTTTISNAGLGINLNNTTGSFIFTRNGTYSITYTCDLNDGTNAESAMKLFMAFKLNGADKDALYGSLTPYGFGSFSTTVVIDITKINEVKFFYIPYFPASRNLNSYVTICEV